MAYDNRGGGGRGGGRGDGRGGYSHHRQHHMMDMPPYDLDMDDDPGTSVLSPERTYIVDNII